MVGKDIYPQLKRYKITVFAHRGYHADPDITENTIEAYNAAIEAGADYIEIDVRLTKDGVPVIYHDNTLRKIGPEVGVESFTIEELKRLKLPDGSQIPTLEEVLELTSDKIGIEFDVKAKNIMPLIDRMVNRFGAAERVHFSSFHYKEVKTIKKLNPRYLSAIIIGGWKKYKITSDKTPDSEKIVRKIKRLAVKYRADAVHINYRYVNSYIIEELRKEGYIINVWTVNNPDKMKELIGMGVDGIFTDDCRTLIEMLKKM